MAKSAYKQHREGSRKGEVHRVYDTKGRDPARALGERLKLKPTTLTIWFASWNGKPAAKGKPKPKAKVKEPTSPKAEAAEVVAS
jgi:hypothetical protein